MHNRPLTVSPVYQMRGPLAAPPLGHAPASPIRDPLRGNQTLGRSLQHGMQKRMPRTVLTSAGAGSSVLLERLHSEFRRIREVDGDLQSFRMQWMEDAERWLCQQEHLAAEVGLCSPVAPATQDVQPAVVVDGSGRKVRLKKADVEGRKTPHSTTAERKDLVAAIPRSQSRSGGEPRNASADAEESNEKPESGQPAPNGATQEGSGDHCSKNEGTKRIYCDGVMPEEAQVYGRGDFGSSKRADVSVAANAAPSLSGADDSSTSIDALTHCDTDHSNGVFEEEKIPNDLSPPLSRWADLVCQSLRSAQKDLKQLHPTWVRGEPFMQKALKDQHNLGMFANFSNRLDRRKSSLMDPTRLSVWLTLPARILPEKQPVNPGSGERSLGKMLRGAIMMHPMSHRRLFWVFFGMALMLYDLIVFPLSVFELPASFFIDFMQWTSQIYWTADIVASFITGVSARGELLMGPLDIARSYLTTWFAFDCLVTLPLWLSVFLSRMGDDISTIRSVRYLRMLRFLRLMRLAKFEHLLGETLEFVNSSTVVLSLGIVKLMVYLILLNHFNACLWYTIGDTQTGWAAQVADRDIFYKYVCAMHWALTQFQGTSEIVPGDTLQERCYAVCLLLLALIVLASFVSSLTNMMMQLQQLKEEGNRQQRQIRLYLTSNKISRALSMRVKKYVEWKLQVLNAQQSDTEVLDILPTPMVVEIFYELRQPILAAHPYFELLDQNYDRTFRRICHEGLQPMWQAPRELIFQPRDHATRMYFVLSGVLNYTIAPDGSGVNAIRQLNAPRITHIDVDNLFQRRVLKGDWLCEAALWVDWEYCGEFEAICDASLLTLDTRDFEKVIASHPAAHASAVLYARWFLAAINSFGKAYTDFVPERGLVVDLEALALQHMQEAAVVAKH